MARIFISEEAEIAKTTLEPSPIHHSLGMATCRESEPGFPAAKHRASNMSSNHMKEFAWNYHKSYNALRSTIAISINIDNRHMIGSLSSGRPASSSCISSSNSLLLLRVVFAEWAGDCRAEVMELIWPKLECWATNRRVDKLLKIYSIRDYMDSWELGDYVTNILWLLWISSLD